MCQRVLANMDSFFGATIDVDVAIEVTEHRKLKKRIDAYCYSKQKNQDLLTVLNSELYNRIILRSRK